MRLPKMIYLDNNATTSLIPSVLEAMKVGQLTPLNPSSTHNYGQKAKALITNARKKIAQAIGCLSSNIIFTSGGTEGLNLLIRGLYSLQKPTSPKNPPPLYGHIITSSIEHASIHTTVQLLAKEGANVTFLPPDKDGRISCEEIKKALKPTTRLLIFSYANSETGVKMNVEGIAALAREHRIPLVLDGVAILGKEPFNIPEGVSGIAFSAHKIHGPQGVGFVYLAPTTTLSPLITGGGQEGGRRGGTENVAGILGCAEAVHEAYLSLPQQADQMRQLRDLFEEQLKAKWPSVTINGSLDRLPNTSNLLFPGIDGETLLMLLDQQGVAASMGAACSSLALEPSRVLLEMGLLKKDVNSSLRFSLSRFTTEEEIHRAVSILASLLPSLVY